MSAHFASNPRPHAHSLRSRRWLFAIYASALTIGTHWPKLRIDTPVPNTDKMIHFLAFGGLTLLLWRTGWLSRVRGLLAIVALWIGLDELTQGIPGLGRSVSAADVSAGLLGCLSVACIIWGLRPVGGTADHLRSQCERLAIQRAWRTPSLRWRMILRGLLWFLPAPAFVIANLALIFFLAQGLAPPMPVAPGAPPAAPFSFWKAAVGSPVIWFPAFTVGMVLITAGFAGVAGARRWALLRHSPALIEDHPCFSCGRSSMNASFDDRGWAECPGCGEPIHAGQWIAPPTLIHRGRRPMSRRMKRNMVILILAGAPLVIGVGSLPRIGIDPGMSAMFGVMFLVMCISFGFSLRMGRRMLADVFERQHLQCRECQFDLHATPVDHGLGVCPECGVKFARFDDSSAAASVSRS